MKITGIYIYIHRYVYPSCEYYSTVTESGQYPTSTQAKVQAADADKDGSLSAEAR